MTSDQFFGHQPGPEWAFSPFFEVFVVQLAKNMVKKGFIIYKSKARSATDIYHAKEASLVPLICI